VYCCHCNDLYSTVRLVLLMSILKTTDTTCRKSVQEDIIWSITCIPDTTCREYKEGVGKDVVWPITCTFVGVSCLEYAKKRLAKSYIIFFCSGARGVLLFVAGLVLLVVGSVHSNHRKWGLWPLAVSPTYQEFLNMLTESGMLLFFTSITALVAHSVYFPRKSRERNACILITTTSAISCAAGTVKTASDIAGKRAGDLRRVGEYVLGHHILGQWRRTE
jgi:hypothetical protein